MLALEVEVNLYSRMFQTSLELVIPIIREKICGVRVEFIKESKALSLIFQAWNLGFTTEVGFPIESRTKEEAFEQYHQYAQPKNRLPEL